MKNIAQHPQVLIVGAGLSGLHTAYELHKRNISFMLVEARDRLGGRILSKKFSNLSGNINHAVFELGPSWFWPGQPRIQSLVKELDLQDNIFEQTEKGVSLYEDQDNKIHKGITGASMQGSYRIEGGMHKIIAELEKHIPTSRYLTNACVTELEYQNQHIESRFLVNHKMVSKFVILALPPRLAITSINFKPSIESSRAKQLRNTATWMAGHAKAVILYEHPFWHEQGLSGDVISQRGPLQEIHDASPANGSPFGLFGFFGAPAKHRRHKQDELRIAVIDQLVRLFGENAASPLEFCMKDWAFDPYTSTTEDQELMMFHPSNNLNTTVESDWGNRLIWSGTETAGMSQHNNGYLEGALEASEESINTLLTQLKLQNKH